MLYGAHRLFVVYGLSKTHCRHPPSHLHLLDGTYGHDPHYLLTFVIIPWTILGSYIACYYL